MNALEKEMAEQLKLYTIRVLHKVGDGYLVAIPSPYCIEDYFDESDYLLHVKDAQELYEKLNSEEIMSLALELYGEELRQKALSITPTIPNTGIISTEDIQHIAQQENNVWQYMQYIAPRMLYAEMHYLTPNMRRYNGKTLAVTSWVGGWLIVRLHELNKNGADMTEFVHDLLKDDVWDIAHVKRDEDGQWQIDDYLSSGIVGYKNIAEELEYLLGEYDAC